MSLLSVVRKFGSIFSLTLVVYAMMEMLTGRQAAAHVKWVIDTEAIPMGNKSELFTTFNFTNVSLSLVALVLLGLLLLVAPKLNHVVAISNIQKKLSKGKKYAPVVLSIALGINLIVSAARQTVLAPELSLIAAGANYLSWIQLILGVMLVLGVMTRLAALGTLAVFGLGYSLFHGMILDYLETIGVAIYLVIIGRDVLSLDKLFKQPDISNLFAGYQSMAMPLMRIFAGITLFWLGIDKWIRPEWGLAIIEEYHLFTFGFSPEIFVFGAGLVEAAVGLAVIAGLLPRLIAVVVLGLFATTAMIFSVEELLGHIVLIAVMYAFFTEGSGGWQLEKLFFSAKGKKQKSDINTSTSLQEGV